MFDLFEARYLVSLALRSLYASYRCFLKLGQLSLWRFDFECNEPAIDAGGYIRYPGCAVHATVCFPAEAAGQGFEVLEDLIGDRFLVHVTLSASTNRAGIIVFCAWPTRHYHLPQAEWIPNK